MNSYERTGWRDLELSGRHRLWGPAVTMVDIDFLAAEYMSRKTVAVIEYKLFTKLRSTDFNSSQIEAIGDLAADKPFFVVFYWPVRWKFALFPYNDAAASALATFGVPSSADIKSPRWITEKQFVELQYSLRGLPIPDFLRFHWDGMLDGGGQ